MDSYINYVNSFKKLDTESKQDIIVNNIKELISLLGKIGNKYDLDISKLSILEDYDSYETFLNSIFTYIICLKEINADIVNLILENIE